MTAKIDYTVIIELFDLGVSDESISKMCTAEESTIRRYRTAYNSAKKGIYQKSSSNKALYDKLNEHFNLAPPVEEKEEEPKPVAVEAKDNGVIYMTKLLEGLHSIDEHLLQLMDADMREAASMVMQCITSEVATIQSNQLELIQVMKSMQGEMQNFCKVISLLDNADAINVCCSDIYDFLKRNTGSQTEGALTNFIMNQKGYNREVYEKALFKLTDSKRIKAISLGSGTSKLTKYSIA